MFLVERQHGERRVHQHVIAGSAPLRRFCRFVDVLAPALLTCCVAATAHAADPTPVRSLLGDDTLARYRTELTCRDGRAFGTIQATLRAEAAEAQSARYMQHEDAKPLGVRAATDFDRAAQVAAARTCPAQARQLWTTLLQDYTGPEYADVRARAEAGLRALPAAAQ
jgi:hypothetical protein